MNAVTDATLAVGPVTPPAAQASRDRPEQRVVEPAEQSTLETEGDPAASTPASAILQLVRDSAEAFRELIETVQNVETAAAITGFSPGTTTGATVDLYA